MDGNTTQTPLGRVLLRFADPGASHCRGAGVGTDDARTLAHVLNEIDETVLPRRIAVTSRAGGVVMTVSNRRLVALERDGGAPLPDGQGGAADRWARALNALVRDGGRISGPAQRHRLAEGEGDTACSARQLAAAAGVDLDAFHAKPDLADLIAELAPRAEAWILHPGAGAAERSGGAAALHEGLRAVQAAMPAAGPDRIGTSEPTCTLLGVAGDRLLLSAAAAGATLHAILPADARTEAIAAWQRRF